MDRLDAMRIFVLAIDSGSLSAAARQLRMPLATVSRRLSELETQARANGSAVGSAFLYPVSIARIAAWAKGLESRGFVLVPVSAIVAQPTK